jgi:hypothetical protein
MQRKVFNAAFNDKYLSSAILETAPFELTKE